MTHSTFSKQFFLASLAVITFSAALPADPLVDLDQEWRIQFHAIAHEMNGRNSDRPYDEHLNYHRSDRHPTDVVLRRTEAMLNDLEGTPGFDLDAAACRAELAELKALADGLPKMGRVPSLQVGTVGGKDRDNLEKRPNKAGTVDLGAHEEAFVRACELNRKIALANPLVKNIDRLVFAKKYPPRMGHMCDQWFGMAQDPGGGLFVLENPTDATPSLTNLTKGEAVESGPMAGKTLKPGAFASPAVSYDGKHIYFAYSGVQEAFSERWEEAYLRGEAKPWGGKFFSEEFFRSEEDSFNIMKVNADGSGLVQLTGDAEEDFSPCVLPNGRLAFVSTRRGGEGRCHPRPNPSYVLHSMLPDGSDIQPLSYHEINEWSPHVNNSGEIVYSRWDYMDRSFSDGQQTWIAKPDGRDSRDLFGNYESVFRGKVMEDFRAVPDSPLYVGVKHKHHGSAYGELMIYDSREPDTEEQPGLTTLTPHSSQSEYATPYPLSENYFLSAWSPDTPNLTLNTFRWYFPPTPHGLYILDRWGNRTLLYRDTEIGSIDPVPLQARPKPPVLPHAVATAAPPGQQNNDRDPKKATFAVMDVYNSRMPWPEDRKIKELRVVQIFPKTTPSVGNPRISYNKEINARGILGNVPVEEDGSAHFEVPAGVPIYLQALDEDGLAIQSMRTSFYGMPGEVNTCVGCHEPKGAPRFEGTMPLAMTRPPSVPTNAPTESFPISFARMVQPVLEQNCVECHDTDKSGKAPSFASAGASHRQLKEWAFCLDQKGNIITMPKGEEIPTSPVRTIPGKTGAVMSRLYPLLTEGSHKDLVELSEEDMTRLTAWLDNMSVFYGAYEETSAQAAGEKVMPSLY